MDIAKTTPVNVRFSDGSFNNFEMDTSLLRRMKTMVTSKPDSAENVTVLLESISPEGVFHFVENFDDDEYDVVKQWRMRKKKKKKIIEK